MRLATTFASLALTIAPAAAQTIELGSDDLIKQTVERAGYDSVRITQRQLTIVRTEACKGDTKYRVKVSILGKITSEEARGRCDLRPARAERRRAVGNDGRPLRNQRRAPADNGARPEPGEVVQASQLRGILRSQGYRRIEIIDNNLPRYLVEACLGDERQAVAINGRGRIFETRRIGACRERQRIDAATIPQVLQRAGIENVRVLRGDRAPYLAEGCQGDRRVEVRLNRFGEITARDNIGRCEPALTVDDVKATLEKGGLMRVAVKPRGRGFTAEVCRNAERYALTINARGLIRDERRIGACNSQSVLNVLETLESRGASRTRAFVEGCFRNQLFRWSFNRLGERTGREKVGVC